MMAVSARLVWRKEGLAGASLSLGAFAAQLILNTLWSVIFFGLEVTGAAFGEIVLLWLAIAATLFLF